MFKTIWVFSQNQTLFLWKLDYFYIKLKSVRICNFSEKKKFTKKSKTTYRSFQYLFNPFKIIIT